MGPCNSNLEILYWHLHLGFCGSIVLIYFTYSPYNITGLLYGSLEIIEAIKTRLFTEDDGGYVPVESTMALATGAFKVAGEVFASSIVQGGPAPGFLCPLVSLFRPFKEAANIRWTMISAQILHKNKKKWRDAPKRKTDTTGKHSLKKTADCTAPRSQID